MSEERECDAPTYPEPIQPEPLPIPSGSGGGQAVVVDELPEKGEEGISYWVKKEGSDSYVIYQWIGGEWRKLDMEATLYKSTGTHEDGAMTQKATTDALATKATKTELNSLANTVSGKANQSDLTSLSNTVATKASQSDLTALENDVADKADKSTVEDLADEVADKADKTEIKTYTGGKRITVNQDNSIDADGLVILSYGNSSWQDFLDAYNENAIVYCRASSEVNPATGSQGRLAFMAFVTNPTNPTAVEFQYFRSVTKKDATQQCDQIYVYKLTSANKWTVEVRNVASEVVAGEGLNSTYENGELTLSTSETIWEVDGTTVTTGLVAVGEDISANPNWQLTNLDLTPYKRIKIFTKAAQKAGTTASASTTPAMVLEMSLDPRAAIAEYGGNYVGSMIAQKPNDSNRLCTLTCAVSADKTKFEVLRMTNLYGTAATSNSDVNAYVFKIEGYYD